MPLSNLDSVAQYKQLLRLVLVEMAVLHQLRAAMLPLIDEVGAARLGVQVALLGGPRVALLEKFLNLNALVKIKHFSVPDSGMEDH